VVQMLWLAILISILVVLIPSPPPDEWNDIWPLFVIILVIMLVARIIYEWWRSRQ
jgi:membrane protein DedA with SNARE-associated domain